MRFGIVFRRHLLRSKTKLIDAESLDAVKQMSMDLPENVFVEWLIDFDERKMIHVSMTNEGRLVEVPEGDWGPLTEYEHFVDEQPDFFAEQASESE